MDADYLLANFNTVVEAPGGITRMRMLVRWSASSFA